MRCQYLAAILAEQVKRIGPGTRPLEFLAISPAHGTDGVTISHYRIDKHSDKGVPLRTIHDEPYVTRVSHNRK